MDAELKRIMVVARITIVVLTIGSLTWVSLKGVSYAVQLPSNATNEARVRVVVSDSYGNVVDVDARTRRGGRITLRRQDVEISANTRETLTLEFGEYQVQVELPGFKTSFSTAVINQPEQVIRVAMRIEGMHFVLEPCSIVGQITPSVNGVTIRLLELFGLTLIDVPVKSDGSFEFQNVECGDYMLMAVAPTGCLGMQFVRVPEEPGNKNPARIQIRLANENRSRACNP